jgi:hypothetical protein
MASHPEFNVPAELDDILDRLPTGLALHVPDDFLEMWFPPGVVADVMEKQARERAERYAATCGCTSAIWRALARGASTKAPGTTSRSVRALPNSIDRMRSISCLMRW